jgi:hypothetical protein
LSRSNSLCVGQIVSACSPEHSIYGGTRVALGGSRPYDLGTKDNKQAQAMAINPTPRIIAEFKPKFEIKVDLDERAYLFPAGKSVSQLLFLSDGRTIFVEAVYPFNQSHTPPRVVALDLEDAREFGRRLIEAVHCARTQLVVTSGIRISINVVANGYHLQFGDMNNATELFLGTNCIWRVCQGLLRVADLIAPVESN